MNVHRSYFLALIPIPPTCKNSTFNKELGQLATLLQADFYGSDSAFSTSSRSIYANKDSHYSHHFRMVLSLYLVPFSLPTFLYLLEQMNRESVCKDLHAFSRKTLKCIRTRRPETHRTVY